MIALEETLRGDSWRSFGGVLEESWRS